jgi:hypothetical protein
MAGALELSDPSALAGLAELAKEALLALPPIPPDARLRVGERRPDVAMMAWLTLILELSQAHTQSV